MMDDSTVTTKIINKTNSSISSTVSKEEKNVVVKRDIRQKKEPVNIIFCGYIDAGKSTIGGRLM
jgi:GTPase